jgi:hypothetical protein
LLLVSLFPFYAMGLCYYAVAHWLTISHYSSLRSSPEN